MAHVKTVDVELEERSIEVEYVFYPAVRETLIDPSEPADMEVLRVWHNGMAVACNEVSPADWEEIRKEIFAAEGLDI